MTSFLVLQPQVQANFKAAGQPLPVLPLTDFAVTGPRGNVIWRDLYNGSAEFEPLYCEKPAGGASWECAFSDRVEFSIKSDDLSSIEAHYRPDGDIFKIEYVVSLRNGVRFYAAQVSHRLDFDAVRDGFPAQVRYEWPHSNFRFSKNELREHLQSVRFPASPAGVLEIMWGDGRREHGMKWKMVTGSPRNRRPVAPELHILRGNASIKIPAGEIREFRHQARGKYTDFLLRLVDGRKLEGEISDERMWHGTLDVGGVSVWVSAPWWFVDRLEITDHIKNVGTVELRPDRMMFFEKK